MNKKPLLSNLKLLILLVAISPVLILFQNCTRLETGYRTDTIAVGSMAVVPPGASATSIPFDISPRAASVIPGGQIQFSITRPTDGLSFGVISGGGSVNNAGLFTAPFVNSEVVLAATNSEGASIFIYVRVSADNALALVPTVALVAPGSDFQFAAIGGVKPYTFSLMNNAASSIEASTGIFHADTGVEIVELQVTDANGAVSQGRAQVLTSATLAISAILTPSQLMTGQAGTLVITGGYGTAVATILSGHATIAGNHITAGDTPSTVMVRITDEAGQILDFPIVVTQDPSKVSIHISGNGQSGSLFTMAGSPTQVVDVVVTIDAGVEIGATSTAGPALTTGVFPAGSTVKLINKGKIMGAGGTGGTSVSGSSTAGVGGAGGPALSLQYPLSILNQGQILGGGGGGGAGGTSYYTHMSGGGGGGGCGSPGGAGGASTHASANEYAMAGSAGSKMTYGVGGSGDNSVGGDSHAWPSGAGGFGGCWGQAGTSGGAAAYVGGAGGAAGAAIITNGQLLIWISGSDMSSVKGSVQ